MTVVKLPVDEFLVDIPYRNIEKDDMYKVTDSIMLTWLTDRLNKEGIDSELRYMDTDYIIHLFGKDVYVMANPDPEDPVNSLIDLVKWFVNEVNALPGKKAWYAYKNGTHSLVIEDKPKLDPAQQYID